MVDLTRTFNITKEKANELNSTYYEVGNNKYQLIVDPNNPINKTLVKLIKTPEGIQRIPTTLSEVQAVLTSTKFTSIKPNK